jgi:hypothetical protein
MIKKIFGLLLFGAALLSMQGCAPSVYAVDPPEASKYVFDGAGSQSDSRLNIIDGRDDQYTSFTSGALPMGLTHNGEALDPVDFLAKYTIEELVARGIAVSTGSGDATDVCATIARWDFRHLRRSLCSAPTFSRLTGIIESALSLCGARFRFGVLTKS